MADTQKAQAAVRVRDLNKMAAGECAALLRNVVERWPAAASALCAARPYSSAANIADAAVNYLDSLVPADKEEVLRRHPELATREALTQDSSREQQAAGLRGESGAAVASIRELSHSYKSKFGFPFVICVRENKADAILEGLQRRLQNSKEDELKTGISEVKKICSLRIKDLLED